MKVSELGNEEDGYALLDIWVAKAEGVKFEIKPSGRPYLTGGGVWVCYAPHRNWSQGGPIIEREIAALEKWWDNIGEKDFWEAKPINSEVCEEGPTPLIAAMRARVASKFGEEV